MRILIVFSLSVVFLNLNMFLFHLFKCKAYERKLWFKKLDKKFTFLCNLLQIKFKKNSITVTRKCGIINHTLFCNLKIKLNFNHHLIINYAGIIPLPTL